MKTEIWNSFLKGDDSAFSLLYTTFFQELYVYALRLGFDAELSKDAIHDLFYNLYTSKHKLQHVENIEIYLFVSLKNRLYTVSKKEKTTEAFDEVEAIDEDFDALKRMIDDEVDKQMEEAVRSMIETLRPKQRKAIYYRYYLNMKYAEIAVLLDIKPDSAKKMVHRTLLQLKGQINTSDEMFQLLLPVIAFWMLN